MNWSIDNVMKKLPKVIYRMADLGDLDALILVGDQLFDNPVIKEIAHEFLTDKRHHLAIAEYERSIIAMASGFLYIHPDKKVQLFVNEVSVLESWRNLGVGRRVVKTLCDHAKSIGVEEAWIATEESNISAIRAYEAAGGVVDPEKAVVLTYEL